VVGRPDFDPVADLDLLKDEGAADVRNSEVRLGLTGQHPTARKE
jgi:hypothetical protein